MRAVARAASAVFLISTLFVIPAAHASATNPGDFSITAHRGVSHDRSITENTLRAAAIAVARGATAVEFDVQPTLDDQIVVMHDATLRRTTRCRGLVARKTLARLERCRGYVDGEHVPSFDAMLAWAAGAGVNLMVDIKTDPKGRMKLWTRDLLAQLVSKIDASGMNDRVRYLSFRPSHLAMVEELSQHAATTVIVLDAGASPVAALNSGAGIDVASMCAEDVTPEIRSLLDSEEVAYQARETDNVSQWTLDRALGAQAVVVDRPQNYLTWRDTGTYTGLVRTKPCQAAATATKSSNTEGMGND